MKQEFSRKRFLYLTTGAAAASAMLGCASEQDTAQNSKRSGKEVAQAENAGQGREPSASREGITRVEVGRSVYGDNTFISPLAEIYGDIYVGQGVFIAGNTVLRAAPNLRLDVGN